MTKEKRDRCQYLLGVISVCSYLGFLFGIGASDIGELPTVPTEPFTWTLPFSLIGFVSPALFGGWLIGRYGRSISD